MIEFIYRRNAVREALRGRRTLKTLYIQEGLPKKEASPFIHAAKQAKIPVQTAKKQKLGNLAQDRGHQGVVLETSGFPYAEIEDMLALAESKQESPLLLILDLVQGPQNVGMLLRSAESVGIHGIIMQERRAPDITPSMVAASAGATEHLLIAKVTNLNTTLRSLKSSGVWIAGADIGTDAQLYTSADMTIPLAIIIGHEGDGIRHQVRQNCDFIIEIPQRGKVESLNASVSGSILLYEAWRQRGLGAGG